MKARIIEVIELGQPKSLIQRQGSPTSELIETDGLVEELRTKTMYLIDEQGQNNSKFLDDVNVALSQIVSKQQELDDK